MICVGDITSALGREGRGCSVHWRDIMGALEDIISEFGKYHYRCGTPAMH